MIGRIQANPVDLQDRDGFLAFLRRQGEQGLQPVRIYPTHTRFQPSPAAPGHYALTFDAADDDHENLFALQNGIAIRPAAAASDDPLWCERVLADYDRFTAYRLTHLPRQLLQPVPFLILLLAGLRLRGLFSLPPLTAYAGTVGIVMALLGAIVLCQAVMAAIRLLSCCTDRLHRREMQAAAAQRRPYRTPAGKARLVRIKNFLVCRRYGVVLLAELLYLLFLLLL